MTPITTFPTASGTACLCMDQDRKISVLVGDLPVLNNHQINGIPREWRLNALTLRAALRATYIRASYDGEKICCVEVCPRLLGGGNNPSSEGKISQDHDRMSRGWSRFEQRSSLPPGYSVESRQSFEPGCSSGDRFVHYHPRNSTLSSPSYQTKMVSGPTRYPLGLHSVKSAKVVTGMGYRIERREAPSTKSSLLVETPRFSIGGVSRREEDSTRPSSWKSNPPKVMKLKRSRYQGGLVRQAKEGKKYHIWDHKKPLSGTNESARESYGPTAPLSNRDKEVLGTVGESVVHESIAKMVRGLAGTTYSCLASLFTMQTLGDPNEQKHLMLGPKEKLRLANELIKQPKQETTHQVKNWEIEKITNTIIPKRFYSP